MSKGNRSAREMLEDIYGSKCMIHEGIRKLNPPQPNWKKYRGKSIARQLTYHHLKAKRNGGHATVENGACLCKSCHEWLEHLSNSEREKVNDELRRYKENFVIGVADFTTEGIQQAEVYRPKVVLENVIVIPAYDNVERGKAVIDSKWQKEILDDNADEIRC